MFVNFAVPFLTDSIGIASGEVGVDSSRLSINDRIKSRHYRSLVGFGRLVEVLDDLLVGGLLDFGSHRRNEQMKVVMWTD